MSQHKVEVAWKRETKDFTYDTYDRTHTIRFEGGITVKGSAAPEFFGKKEYANPEELLIAALSTCHMLTFLAIAAKSRLIVDSYLDSPVGFLEKGENGILWVTQTVLHPKITFSGEVPSPEKIQQIHEKAHRNCFIANSVKTKVTVAN